METAVGVACSATWLLVLRGAWSVLGLLRVAIWRIVPGPIQRRTSIHEDILAWTNAKRSVGLPGNHGQGQLRGESFPRPLNSRLLSATRRGLGSHVMRG